MQYKILEHRGESTEALRKKEQQEEMAKKTYWTDPENQHRGFERYENLMKELRQDYDRHQGEISNGILRACGNSYLDNNTTQRLKRLNKNLELSKPEKRAHYLEEYVKQAVVDLLDFSDSD